MNYSNTLQISQKGKGIPYGSAGASPDEGDANFGFMNIKGSLDRIAEIPELQRDKALRDLVTSLNLPQSAFATIGCVSGRVDEKQGHRVSGYVEFAFDSIEAVADAANYFPVFFHFDRALYTTQFEDRVHFHWMLMGATFVTAAAHGFTVIVTVNTDWYPTADNASVAWQNGLDFLAGYLAQVPPAGGTPLFTDAMNLNR